MDAMKSPIQHYLRIVEMRRYTTAVIRKDGHFRLLNGCLITERDFDRLYPMPERVVIPIENPDKTRIY